ncbi:MAG: hypothetical protein C5B51_02780 [Terriglobia bacterium]|nr:MAG: hypothetical protein C5B51_02780 [Terriglobia bacterium]
MTFRRIFISMVFCSTLALCLAAQDARGGFRSHPVRIPGGSNVFVYGINDSGEMVANYTDAAGTNHCATITGNIITEIADPKAVGTGPGKGTTCFGINNAGQVVGAYSLDVFSNGFAYTGGQYVDIVVPGATAGTVAVGLNNIGNIVGYYADDVTTHGFLYVVQTNTYGTLNMPGASATLGVAINDSGLTTLQWLDLNGVRHGGTFQAGGYTPLDVPNSLQSAADGVNAQGQIIFRAKDTSGIFHAYLYSNGTFTQFDVANAADTHGFGINSSTQIVGAYNPARDPTTQIGFEGHF